MNKDIERVVLTKSRIKSLVADAAKWLDKRFEGAKEAPLAVCVLKGAAMFFCDLMRAMKTSVQFEFLTVSSYGLSYESSGEIHIISDLSASVSGRDVILVEDIVDSGLTISNLKRLFEERGAKSVTSVTLFDKPESRKSCAKADYSCFKAGEGFLVGYGIDYAQRYRNLPYVGVLKKQVYENDGKNNIELSK